MRLFPELTLPFCAYSGYEYVEKEQKRQRTAQGIKVKQEQLEETKTSLVSSPAQSTDCDAASPERKQDKDSFNLFLQKPGSFSKLSKLLEVAKMAQDSDISCHSSHSTKVPTAAASYPSHPTAQTNTSQQGLIDKTGTAVPSLLKITPWITCGPQSVPHDDQLSKILTEKSNQWFSLFPRSPCDESSVTSGSSPPASSSPLQATSIKSFSSLSPDPPASASSGAPARIQNTQSSALQVGG